MKTHLFCILMFTFFISSCTRYTRIGSTRYPLGKAKATKFSQAPGITSRSHPDEIDSFKTLPDPGGPSLPQATVPDTASPVAAYEKKTITDTSSSKKLSEFPRDTIPADTTTLLNNADKLLSRANMVFAIDLVCISVLVFFYVGYLWGQPLVVLALFLFMIALLAGDLVFLSFLIPFIMVFLILPVIWIVTTLIFWKKYGKHRSLIRKSPVTKEKYGLHIGSLLLIAATAFLHWVWQYSHYIKKRLHP